MTRSSRLLATAITLVFCVALAGCGVGSKAVDQSAGSDKRFVAGDGTLTRYRADDRSDAPRIEGELLNGDDFDLHDFRGKVVVLNFWGQWCAPCRAEADDLVTVYNATKDSGVEFIGVNVRDSKDRARAFERNFDVPYPSLFDAAGRVALRFRDTPPNTVPATIVIDRSGKVAAVFRKPLVTDDLQPVIQQIAAE